MIGEGPEANHRSCVEKTATTPYECAPEGLFDHQRMPDGAVLVRRQWPCDDAARGVLIVHGLGEHSGRYRHVAAWFNARGWDVCSYDQRGHGRSPGSRGKLQHPDDLLTDLATIYAGYARGFDTSPLLLGHSMGGLVAARAVLDGCVKPAGLVLSSPAMRSFTPAVLRRVAHVLAPVLPHVPFDNGLPLDVSSHDPAVGPAARADPLCSTRITPRLADFIFRAGPSCIADAAALDVPTLLLVAGADRVVDPAGSRDFAAAAGEVLSLHEFDGLYHELFNEAEPGRSEVMACLERWLEAAGFA